MPASVITHYANGSSIKVHYVLCHDFITPTNNDMQTESWIMSSEYFEDVRVTSLYTYTPQ